MQIKKSGKTIFGANLSAAEKKALNIEIGRQLSDWNQKNIAEVDACILWTLFYNYGWSHEQLREFYDQFHDRMNKLSDYYQLGKSDQPWLCTQKLKDIGINLEEWEAKRDEHA